MNLPLVLRTKILLITYLYLCVPPVSLCCFPQSPTLRSSSTQSMLISSHFPFQYVLLDSRSNQKRPGIPTEKPGNHTHRVR